MSNAPFYNKNAGRGYPIDGLATGLSDDTVEMPNGILVDGCVRFSSDVGTYAFLSAVRISAKFVSVVISVAETLDGPGVPIAAVTLGGSVVPGRPYQLRALVTGAGGWIVFGLLASIDYAGRFTTARQSLLMPRMARAYTPLPIPYAQREGTVTQLLGDVGLYAGTDVVITRQTVKIADADRDAIVIGLAGPLQTTLSRYAGPCGGRPESHTCAGYPVERIGGVSPDADGNIEIVLQGAAGTLTDVPGGILLNVPYTVTGLCGDPLALDDDPVDLCASEISEISEISEPAASESEGAGGGGGGGDSESESETSEFIPLTYPICGRFYSTLANPLTQVGAWTQDFDTLPPRIPCSDFGQLPATFQVMRAAASSSLATAVYSHTEYPVLSNMAYSTALRITAAAQEGGAGIAWSYRLLNGARVCWYAMIDGYSNKLVIQQFQGTFAVGVLYRALDVPLELDAWYRLNVFMSERSGSSRISADIHVVKIETYADVVIARVRRIMLPPLVTSTFGLCAIRQAADFAYIHGNLA